MLNVPTPAPVPVIFNPVPTTGDAKSCVSAGLLVPLTENTKLL